MPVLLLLLPLSLLMLLPPPPPPPPLLLPPLPPLPLPLPSVNVRARGALQVSPWHITYIASRVGIFTDEIASRRAPRRGAMGARERAAPRPSLKPRTNEEMRIQPPSGETES